MTDGAPRPLRDATRVLRAGLPAPAQGAPPLPGPTFASHFHLEGDPATAPYVYGRYGNPTWTLYERALVMCSGLAPMAALSDRETRYHDVTPDVATAIYSRLMRWHDTPS